MVLFTAAAGGVVVSARVTRVGDEAAGFAAAIFKVTVTVVVGFGALGPWCIS